MIQGQSIGVVIPCYKVTKHIISVVRSIPNYIDCIIIVDDKCPENSGKYVIENCIESRIAILHNEKNLGVGGAMIEGYREALRRELDIVVKIDGDGQMDPSLIINFVSPLINNECDYAKGNRFHWFENLKGMPLIRLIGNSTLSFINKATSGYWDIMDPTNGFTAINKKSLSHLPFKKIDNRYFFESDMLFRLGINNARVRDIPMEAKYSDEKSNLSITNTLFTFPWKYFERFLKRIVYIYFLRDFNQGSLSLTIAILCLFVGGTLGIYKWIIALYSHTATPTGTLFIVALFLIFGIQFLISFMNYDVQKRS